MARCTGMALPCPSENHSPVGNLVAFVVMSIRKEGLIQKKSQVSADF